jgi:hypothetical protein
MKLDRADHYLTWVEREIARIRDVEPRWDSEGFPVEERMATRLEWDDVVDRYLAVVHAHDEGQLSGVTTTRLADVSAQLAALLPLLERLRLRRPDPGILARLRLAAAG